MDVFHVCNPPLSEATLCFRVAPLWAKAHSLTKVLLCNDDLCRVLVIEATCCSCATRFVFRQIRCLQQSSCGSTSALMNSGGISLEISETRRCSSRARDWASRCVVEKSCVNNSESRHPECRKKAAISGVGSHAISNVCTQELFRCTGRQTRTFHQSLANICNISTFGSHGANRCL